MLRCGKIQEVKGENPFGFRKSKGRSYTTEVMRIISEWAFDVKSK
jgi:hypothetical protein